MSSDIEKLSVQLLEHVPFGVLVWYLDDPADDGSLRLLYANRASGALLPADLGSRVGRRISEAFPSVPAERVRLYADICRQRTPRDVGQVLYGESPAEQSAFSVCAIPVLDRGVALVVENLSALKHAEAETRRLNRFLDSILEQLPAMVFVKDAETLRFQRFNRAGEELLGLKREELIGKSDHDFFPKDQAAFFVAKDREVLQRRTLEDIPEEPIQTPAGTRWLHTRKIPVLDESGEPRHLLGVSIDITVRKQAEEILRASYKELEQRVSAGSVELERQVGERHRAERALARQIDERLRAERALAQTEEQLRQSQKLEAIGRLAGGVAHDFNNILSVVLGYSDLIANQLHPSDPLRGDVREILRAAERAADLTRQLLAFSRQQVLRPQVLDLGDVVHNMERMLPRLLGEDIELTIRTAPGLSRVKADPSQIEQVVMNLVVNARDAMPTGGQLTVETAPVELDEVYVREHVGARAGPHVMLAVSDTGVGMTHDTLIRIFEPFFTTKEKGKGTGLGLSTVFGIVKQSGGSIWAYSEPGHGATFKVYLPVAGEAEPPPAPAEPPPTLRGSEAILLVEDDAQLRELTASILRRYGYRVTCCGNGAEALVTARGRNDPIDLLLTDVVMPEMSGRVLAAQLGERMPELRVLFMSGYTDDAVVRHGVLESGMEFLQKPFTPELLARRIREVLRAPRKGPLPVR